MKKNKDKICSCNIIRRPRAFSLVEIVTVLAITSMVILATLNVYGRVRQVSERIKQNLAEGQLPREILQRIAEDLDRMAVSGFDTKLTIQNKTVGNYNLSQLVMENFYYDSQNRPQSRTFEKIIWQTAYDTFTDSLILYRQHRGVNLEDKVIDIQIEDLQKQGRYLFIPVCDGITFFEIAAVDGERSLNQWPGPNLPTAVDITISFAEPVTMITGRKEIADDAKITRTVAIDRARKIAYSFKRKEFDLESDDPNGIGDEIIDEQTDPNTDSSGR